MAWTGDTYIPGKITLEPINQIKDGSLPDFDKLSDGFVFQSDPDTWLASLSPEDQQTALFHIDKWRIPEDLSPMERAFRSMPAISGKTTEALRQVLFVHQEQWKSIQDDMIKSEKRQKKLDAEREKLSEQYQQYRANQKPKPSIKDWSFNRQWKRAKSNV